MLAQRGGEGVKGLLRRGPVGAGILAPGGESRIQQLGEQGFAVGDEAVEVRRRFAGVAGEDRLHGGQALGDPALVGFSERLAVERRQPFAFLCTVGVTEGAAGGGVEVAPRDQQALRPQHLADRRDAVFGHAPAPQLAVDQRLENTALGVGLDPVPQTLSFDRHRQVAGVEEVQGKDVA